MNQSALISPEYLEQQKALHETGNYGVMGRMYADIVMQVVTALRTESILDYGCGQQTLQQALPMFTIDGYDPAIPGLDAEPEPHDVVVCTDVLEHIEPDKLDAVLDNLRYLTRKVVVLAIDTGPANKVLPDGRNAHLIQEGVEFWLPKLWTRWSLDTMQCAHGKIIVTGSAKEVQ